MAMAKWKEGTKNLERVSAQKCADEIAGIGPDFMTADIVKLAMDESTELHKCFCWNDREIIDKYMTMQAVEIIKSLVIEESSMPSDRPEIQMFVPKKKPAGPYVPVQVMSRDDNAYKRLLAQATRELKTFRRKYARLKELDDIFNAIG